MLVDSHCHLNFEQLESQLDLVLERAKESEIGVMQTICTKISEFPNILKIVEQYENIFASVGIHPHEVENQQKISVNELKKLTLHQKVIGIGETGLDYYYDYSPRKLQQQSFIKHIEVAQETGLPIIIHTRNADDDTIELIEQQMSKKTFKGLIHCFTSSKKLAKIVLDLGMYISISGIITFNKAEDLREIVKFVPLDRLLVETDSPYLAPVPHRGKVNEPAYTKFVAQKIAELKNVTYSKVAEQTTENFFNLFTKAYR